jgi:anti-anti-sigma regulatory factor
LTREVSTVAQVSSPLNVAPLPVEADYGGRVLPLRITSIADDTTAPLLDDALDDAIKVTKVSVGETLTHAGERLTHVLVDLSGIRLLSPAGARALARWAERIASRGRRVLVSAADPHVTNVLYQTHATDVVELYPTAEAALATAVRAAAGPGRLERTSRDDFDAELMTLRAQVRTYPLITRAQGVVQERYRISSSRAASLLEETARRFEIPPRTLAAAVIDAPRPASPAEPWFTRPRTPPPAAAFLRRSSTDPADRDQVLDVLLDEALGITDTANADLQLVDPALDVLVLERQQGFSTEFQDFFAHVGDEGTACAAARRSGVRVTVPDVASDPIFAGHASREVILESGTRAVQSTPMLGRTGHCIGMISTHYDRAGRRLTASEEAAMDALTGETAGWLGWYERTVVRDALEHLHRHARR